MSEVDLESVRYHVEILRMAKKGEKDLKKLIADSEDAIKEVMGDNDIGQLDGETVITWVSHKKNQFQQAALKEALPEIAAEFTSLVNARTFRVVTPE